MAGLLSGTGVGVYILRNASVRVERARGVIHRPADVTVLPLVLVVFVVKFAFCMMAAVAPDVVQQPLLRFIDIGLSGLFGGIFAGKFGIYCWHCVLSPSVTADV